jgi:hypothetical protein
VNYLDFISNPTNSLDRVVSANNVGPAFFTAGQSDFRRTARGYDGDPSMDNAAGQQGAANVYRLNKNDKGEAAVTRLDATGAGWVDLGGNPARDFAAQTAMGG